MPEYNLITDKSWDDTMSDLSESFHKWGVGPSAWAVTAIRPRREGGGRYSYQSYTPSERRVRLEFLHPASGQRISVEKSDLWRPQDNLRALYLSIEAIRLIEKRGTTDLVRDALLQIEAPKGSQPRPKRDPYDVLEVMRGASPEVIDAAYRAKAMRIHPDRGGDPDDMKELTEARDAIRAERGAPA